MNEGNINNPDNKDVELTTDGAEKKIREQYLKGDKWVLPTVADGNFFSAVHEEIVLRLKDEGFDDDTAMNVALAVQEAQANALIHGNMNVTKGETTGDKLAEVSEKLKDNPCDKSITISYESDEKGVRITIEDEGDGFAWREMMKDNPTKKSRQSVASRRGIFLCRKFCDRVTFNKKGNAITLMMRKHEKD
jgi:anti-sigma regulatory factor (Ser/Thr protein kinase)